MLLALDNFWFGIISVCRPLPKQNLSIELVYVITNRFGTKHGRRCIVVELVIFVFPLSHLRIYFFINTKRINKHTKTIGRMTCSNLITYLKKKKINDQL